MNRDLIKEFTSVVARFDTPDEYSLPIAIKVVDIVQKINSFKRKLKLESNRNNIRTTNLVFKQIHRLEDEAIADIEKMKTISKSENNFRHKNKGAL